MLRLFRIDGESLSPHLNANDYVLGIKLPRNFLYQHPQLAAKILKTGALLVVEHQRYGRIIKFLKQLHQNGCVELIGSNANSVSSAQMGAVALSDCHYLVIKQIRG